MTDYPKPWKNIGGHMYDSECEFLSELADGKRAIEIGTHHGRSTAAIAVSALSVVTIDTYKGDPQINAPSLEVARINLKPFPNVKIIVGDWRHQNIAPNDYEFIFYDGCHTEEGESLAILSDYRGVLALHDYKPKEPGMRHVVEAVDRFASDRQRAKLLGAGSIVWFDAINDRAETVEIELRPSD